MPAHDIAARIAAAAIITTVVAADTSPSTPMPCKSTSLPSPLLRERTSPPPQNGISLPSPDAIGTFITIAAAAIHTTIAAANIRRRER